jgi:hypothetical protein
VILSAENQPEAPLLSRPSIPEESDPLTIKPGVRILPGTQQGFDSGGSLLVLFWLRGISDTGEQPPGLDVSVNVSDASGRPLEPPTKLLYFVKEPSGGYRAIARVDLATLAPGAYELRLAAGLTGSGAPPARESVPFTLRPKDGPPTTSASAGSP